MFSSTEIQGQIELLTDKVQSRKVDYKILELHAQIIKTYT